MAETIESFVAKLQQDGVQAGREEAERIRAEAQRQAETILSDARLKAEAILADARVQADKTLQRVQGELALVSRDAVLRLREALERALKAVLSHKAEIALQDGEFLSRLLHDLVVEYARADCEGRNVMKINVSQQARHQLAEWALREMTHKADQAHMPIDLKGALAHAGFEYSVNDATVEVTVDSVAEMLQEMASPRLREIIRQAAGQGSDQPAGGVS